MSHFLVSKCLVFKATHSQNFNFVPKCPGKQFYMRQGREQRDNDRNLQKAAKTTKDHKFASFAIFCRALLLTFFGEHWSAFECNGVMGGPS